MHIHASAMHLFIVFVGVLLFTTLWRAAAATMVDRNPALAGAMVSQL